MKDNIYIEFLIEDESGRIMVSEIMEKYKRLHPQYSIDYRVKGFRGLGKLPKRPDVKAIKTGKILNDLPQYLKGISKSLNAMACRKAIFVVLDTDDNNCVSMKNDLTQLRNSLNLTLDVYFCLAIEEIESWLLGDEHAISTAFPDYKRQPLNTYQQDSIVGTWEVLANVVYPGGIIKLNKDSSTYHEKGLQKSTWAKEIGENLNIHSNNSPSFNYFISKLNLVCS